ncbi:phosphate ABC transporter permease PstA [Catenisphaera adipataccumulans]|uniref:Phosphate transport system permease protein PstA n=1 Tax=Catenisphaera adipataccumulans TaxID=700500 RepID=A0A7W8FVD9_9FIRM|nr:phosphate ABC transporter permease PstA [Catenisphaera adipataccumulans]MBB5183519.1 phosphate transport system permease protein [Catenisphaera adipataccumulans]
MDKRIASAKRADKIATVIFCIIAAMFFLLLFGFAGYVIIRGIMSAKPSMFGFTGYDDIGNQLFNTIYLVFISLLVCVPIGVFAGIYLAMYAKPGRFTKFLRMCIETLSSLPSIVVGLFGYLVFLIVLGMDRSLLAGALSISIITLPLITTTTEDAIKGLPSGYLQGSLGMGATKWQSVYHVLLPACLPRIMTGVILAAGRGFGEAAALLYTAGSGSRLYWASTNIHSAVNPWNVMRPAETLSIQIWNLQVNGQNQDLANVSSAVLMVLVLAFSILANALSRHIQAKNAGQVSGGKKR